MTWSWRDELSYRLASLLRRWGSGPRGCRATYEPRYPTLPIHWCQLPRDHEGAHFYGPR